MDGRDQARGDQRRLLIAAPAAHNAPTAQFRRPFTLAGGSVAKVCDCRWLAIAITASAPEETVEFSEAAVHWQSRGG